LLARGALIAQVGSRCTSAFVAGWIHSKKVAGLTIAAEVVTITIASAVFLRYGLHDPIVDPAAADAVTRTIRELQDSDPEFRMKIWSRTLRCIASEPALLPFGRGVGAFGWKGPGDFAAARPVQPVFHRLRQCKLSEAIPDRFEVSRSDVG
jgi:hypothetical protein